MKWAIPVLVCILILGLMTSQDSYALAPDHLLLTEIVTSPTADEFIEIYNPTPSIVNLDNYYLSDTPLYYLVAPGPASPVSADFIIQFPSGTQISPGQIMVISLESASSFNAQYGVFPDFDLDPLDPNAPAMLGLFTSTSGLTNGDEMVVLFVWDGVSDLVSDVDYVVYGNTSDCMNKTGTTVGASTYLNELSCALQDFFAAPAAGQQAHRTSFEDALEIFNGGNGITGHDETSENLSQTWELFASASPFDVVIDIQQVPVGGTSLPIDTTALLVAGVQSISMWLILGVLSAVGIGLAVFTLKRSR